ncbi:hypothetical protein QJS04_geneDACA006520 [Acorus gramineus]|uniref:Protein EXECUTER 1, chloroplastic n=1 Tax=Acorus gramineus TaxID=55184 RepID=A0AAV9AZ13_ACOGR|nr:hypothetical protein QJS04_geneDACA006520 [Acorus gramineus]
MAAISVPQRFPSPSEPKNANKNLYRNPSFLSSGPRHRLRRSPICLCRTRPDPPPPTPDEGGGGGRGWERVLNDAVRSAVKRWDDYVSSLRGPTKEEGVDAVVGDQGEKAVVEEEDGRDWDWERWKQHFAEVEEQERIVSVLKAQLGEAVGREDFEGAAKLKVAIAAAVTNDAVGRAISRLNKAVVEERYQDASFIRDHAGAGLVGWWAGISQDRADPHGRIIRISAEHGRYVARSYSSRQLTTSSSGFPLFEIYFTTNDGEYKEQAVYLKRTSPSSKKIPGKSFGALKSNSSSPRNDSPEGQNDLSIKSIEDVEDGEEKDDDSDAVADLPKSLRDIITGGKVKVVQVVSPAKVDRDLISKVIEQIIEDEDEEKDMDLESIESGDDVKSDSDAEEIQLVDGSAISDTIEEQSNMSLKFMLDGFIQKSSNMSPKDVIRVPAQIQKKGRLSFSFSVKQDELPQVAGRNGEDSPDKVRSLPSFRSVDLGMSGIAKVFVTKEKISKKMLRDIGETISLMLSQGRNRQPLSGTTLFNRIEIPSTSDPLSGLYIGAPGLFTSDIIHLRRKFGQWQEDGGTQTSQSLEFYEYVEALKLTGDLSVPAGQVAFRAKVGKRYQLPHKGIIPEEFGVVARYKGQGRIAEAGFHNPRWVDGELVILDGRYIRGGPVIGFVYWAPEFHFLVFFNRLNLPD